jgi:hypothetical protein
MKEALNITRKESLRIAAFGILTLLLIICLMFGFGGLLDMFNSLLPNLLLGVMGLFFAIYFLSIPAAKLLYSNKVSPYLMGFLMTIFSLEIGTFIASMLGYFTEGIDDVDGVFDYIAKPVFGILVWGFVPIVALSLILGIRLYNKFEKLEK